MELLASPLNISILLWLLFQVKSVALHSSNSVLLVISIDGFRWDYLDLLHNSGHSTPHFDEFIQAGVRAEYLQPCFPSKTFPCHMTIATGLYAESHGLVQNKFWDPKYNESFNLDNSGQALESKWFDNDNTVEPIWITNQRGPQTIFPRHSGTIFWPGDSAGYGIGKHEMRADRYEEIYTSLNDTMKISTMISWFTNDDKPINFGMLHLDGADHTGHMFGPDSDEMITKLIQIDGDLGYLMSLIEQNHMRSTMNVIILSDHGMAKIEQNINIDEYIDPLFYDAYGYSPMWQIIPKPDKSDSVIASFQKLAKDRPEIGLKVYLDQKTPKSFHFSNNRRILPIIIMISEPYQLVHNNTKSTVVGDHGYNNSLVDMRAFFAARGPAFVPGSKSGPINQVDIYPLMCHILDVIPKPNNGSMHVLEELLHKEHDNFYITIITFLSSVVFAATVSGVFCVAACRIYRINRVKRRRLELPLDSIPVDLQQSLLTSDEEEIP